MLTTCRRRGQRTWRLLGKVVDYSWDQPLREWKKKPDTARPVRDHYALADVLTVESMIDHLKASNHAPYLALLSARRRWLDEMFDGLAAKGQSRD